MKEEIASVLIGCIFTGALTGYLSVKVTLAILETEIGHIKWRLSKLERD